MVQFNIQQRELILKIVYYGPALSGKTTNLESIHKLIDINNRGKLITLNTKDDRTLFFDLLPLSLKAENLQVKLQIYTVPGQVMHNSTRKLVLQGADGVAFIADSQLNKRDENRQSWLNMYQNLKQNNITPKDFPVVIQFNKRDLPGIIPDQELAKMETASKDPVFSAVAIELAGVHDTFMGLISLLWDSLNRRYDFHRKFKMEKQQFLTDIDQIFKNNKPSSN